LAIISILGCFVGCDDLSECSHTNYTWVTVKQATYNETGLRRAECKDCGASIKTEIISKKKCTHLDSTWIVEVEPSYDSYGFRYLKCNTCGSTVKTEQISKKTCSHSNSEWVIDAQPTFNKEGIKNLICNTCGATVETQYIPKIECTHTSTKWVVDTPATIQKEGSKHLECVDCGANLKTETIPKEKCTHSNTKWIIDIAATVQKEGKKSLKCQGCGVTLQTETIAKLTCSHTDSKWITDVQPTFTKEGSKHLQCNTCGVSVKTEAIPKLTCTHLIQKWIIDVYPTAEETGSKHLECSSCGKTLQTEIIPKCAHTNTKWEISFFPTYSLPGIASKKCLDCGTTVEGMLLPVLQCEHTDTRWVIDKEPTSTTNGSRHLVCNTCGANLGTETIYGKELSQSEIKSKLQDSVIKVMCYDYDGETVISQGSGFFIDDDGTFITNAHVVEDCFYIKVKVESYRDFDVKVMYVYNYGTSDYAICKIDGSYTSKPVEFAESTTVGATVYALGYPNDANYISITKGKITNTNTVVESTQHCYENTAKIDHGSSGGVLVDCYGRVLGITTGQADNGKYLALKYQDFKLDVQKTHTGSKSPLEYFHTVDEISINSSNAEDYFDIYVDGTVTSDTSVSYNVTIALKSKYRNAKILINSTSISFTVNLYTYFEYTEVTNYGNYNRSENELSYIYFRLRDNEDLIYGDTQSATVSASISYATEYYGMQIYYDVEYRSVSGSIIIYDK
jgi:hypothetical protein